MGGICPVQYERSTLGEIVENVRADENDHILVPIIDDLEEINEYCRRYHHGENANAAEEPIVDVELAGYIKLTLKLVGNLPNN